jgi:hypothetical protein
MSTFNYTAGSTSFSAKFTLTVKDANNCSSTCNYTVTWPSLITDTMRCTLANGFDLVFTPDIQNLSCFKLNASNPGQFYYNVFYSPASQPETFTITLPYPWVTQGANPLEVYASVNSSTSGGTTCLTTGTQLAPLSSQVNGVSGNQVTVLSYSPQTMGSTATLTVTVPAGSSFLAIHLDYGLKGQSTDYNNSNGNAILCGGTTTLIPNNQPYTFSASGPVKTSVTITGVNSFQSHNAFKKNPGVGGLVKDQNGNTVQGAVFNLTTDSAGHQVIGTGTSDLDGWYMIPYKWSGKPTTLYVFCIKVPTTPTSAYNYVLPNPVSKSFTLKSNGYSEQDFVCTCTVCPH